MYIAFIPNFLDQTVEFGCQNTCDAKSTRPIKGHFYGGVVFRRYSSVPAVVTQNRAMRSDGECNDC